MSGIVKPRIPVLRRSHPLARGLERLWIPGVEAGTTIDLASRSPLAPSGTVTGVATPYGGGQANAAAAHWSSAGVAGRLTWAFTLSILFRPRVWPADAFLFGCCEPAQT